LPSIEVEPLWYAGRSQHELAASLGVDRKTQRKCTGPARAAGMEPGGPAMAEADWRKLVTGWFPELAEAGLRQVVFGAARSGEFVFQRAFERARDEPVLWFDRVVLAVRSLGLVAGTFHRELEGGQPLPVVGIGFGQRFGGGLQAGRFQNREQLPQHGFLQVATTDGLAAVFGAIQLLGAGAHIAGAVALGSGVAGLHGPPAAAAPQQTLQQRPSFPWWGHRRGRGVGASSRADGRCWPRTVPS
jgi:hypothetical protein